MLGKVGAELGSMMSETKTTQGYHELEGTGGILPQEIQRNMVPLTPLFQTPASRTARQDASVSRGNEHSH